MKFVALISGGKDSTLAIHEAIKQGHELVALAHVAPYAQTVPYHDSKAGDGYFLVNEGAETDSWMYQSVGSELVPLLSCCYEKPLFVIGGDLTEHKEHESMKMVEESYLKSFGAGVFADEGGKLDFEFLRLWRLLRKIKAAFDPQQPSKWCQGGPIQAVVSGAVLSNYQRRRVEVVCRALGWTSISPLWELNQSNLLRMLNSTTIHAKMIKVASIGIEASDLMGDLSRKGTENGRKEIDKESSLAAGSTTVLCDRLEQLNKQYGVNVSGEGGEYESFVFDAPNMLWPRLTLTPVQFQLIRKKPSSSVVENLGTFNNEDDLHTASACLNGSSTHGDVFWIRFTAAAIQRKSSQSHPHHTDTTSQFGSQAYSHQTDFLNGLNPDTHFTLVGQPLPSNPTLSNSSLVNELISSGRMIWVNSSMPVPPGSLKGTEVTAPVQATAIQSSHEPAKPNLLSLDKIKVHGPKMVGAGGIMQQRMDEKSGSDLNENLMSEGSAVAVASSEGEKIVPIISTVAASSTSAVVTGIHHPSSKESRNNNHHSLGFYLEASHHVVEALDDEYSAKDIGEATSAVMNSIAKTLQDNNLLFSDIYFVSITISSMSHFAAMNPVYCSYFLPVENPPSRVTVAQTPIHLLDASSSSANPMPSIRVEMWGLWQNHHRHHNHHHNNHHHQHHHHHKLFTLSSPSSFPSSSFSSLLLPSSFRHNVLHVESYSTWAPACIGPYSQAHSVFGFDHLAGQIALIPHSLTLINPSSLLQNQDSKDISLQLIEYLVPSSWPSSHLVACLMSEVSNPSDASSSLFDRTVVELLLALHHVNSLILSRLQLQPSSRSIKDWYQYYHSVFDVNKSDYDSNHSSASLLSAPIVFSSLYTSVPMEVLHSSIDWILKLPERSQRLLNNSHPSFTPQQLQQLTSNASLLSFILYNSTIFKVDQLPRLAAVEIQVITVKPGKSSNAGISNATNSPLTFQCTPSSTLECIQPPCKTISSAPIQSDSKSSLLPLTSCLHISLSNEFKWGDLKLELSRDTFSFIRSFNIPECTTAAGQKSIGSPSASSFSSFLNHIDQSFLHFQALLVSSNPMEPEQLLERSVQTVETLLARFELLEKGNLLSVQLFVPSSQEAALFKLTSLSQLDKSYNVVGSVMDKLTIVPVLKLSSHPMPPPSLQTAAILHIRVCSTLILDD